MVGVWVENGISFGFLARLHILSCRTAFRYNLFVICGITRIIHHLSNLAAFFAARFLALSLLLLTNRCVTVTDFTVSLMLTLTDSLFPPE